MKQKFIITFAILIAITSLHAQVAVTSSGGNGIGAGGSSSFSIGQVAYTSIGVTTTVAQGVQQTFGVFVYGTPDISVTPIQTSAVTTAFVGILKAPLELKAGVYPNPTSSKIILSLENCTATDLSYALYDLKGRTVASGLIFQSQTSISLQNMAGGLYILKVNQKNMELKSFKIIKE